MYALQSLFLRLIQLASRPTENVSRSHAPVTESVNGRCTLLPTASAALHSFSISVAITDKSHS